MPRPTRPARPRRQLVLLLGGLLCLLAVSAGLAVVQRQEGPAPTAVPAPAPPPPAAGTQTAASEPLLDAPQWARLQASLADQPDRDAQTARIVELLAYQRTVRAFQAARQRGADAATMVPLARQIDAGLAARIARGEVSGPEALRLKAALLEALEPDPARRAQALAAWRAGQLQAHPPATDPRDARFAAEQQALVARWRAQAAPGTPPDALLAELDALRQHIYGLPAPEVTTQETTR